MFVGKQPCCFSSYETMALLSLPPTQIIPLSSLKGRRDLKSPFPSYCVRFSVLALFRKSLPLAALREIEALPFLLARSFSTKFSLPVYIFAPRTRSLK